MLGALCCTAMIVSATAFQGSSLLTQRFHPALRAKAARTQMVARVLPMRAILSTEKPMRQADADAVVQQRKTSRPPVGIIDLLTKYAWGMQEPNIPLPIAVTDGQPPEHCPKVTQARTSAPNTRSRQTRLHDINATPRNGPSSLIS